MAQTFFKDLKEGVKNLLLAVASGVVTISVQLATRCLEQKAILARAKMHSLMMAATQTQAQSQPSQPRPQPEGVLPLVQV